MNDFYAFHAVVGYFRSSGYFRVQPFLKKAQHIKILVGINVDAKFAEVQRQGRLFLENEAETKEEFLNAFVQDIQGASYFQRLEEGILGFIKDLSRGKIELRAHSTKTIHAKFYLFLPEHHSEHSDGWVIMGSSNLTEAGLGIKQPPHYELNVALKEYDDVAFAQSEFARLWAEALPILPEEVQEMQKKTHLQPFKPYEIYMKLLMEYFGEMVDYDPESVGVLPAPFKKLSYQVDAVNQGFQMLMRHNGLFLADVVGLGKTVVACLIAKRFQQANGPTTKILVVYSPALEHNWKQTFRLFGLEQYAKFITNGSLEKVVNGDLNYWPKADYDLILVDESHQYRNRNSKKFRCLQEICKAPRTNEGWLKGRKKVILISATPLNNHPQDLYHQLLLFQDARKSTLPQTNLEAFFNEKARIYNEIKKNHASHEKVRELYKEIREKIIEPVTVRRTRQDLKNYPKYLDDLKEQGIRLPEIAPLESINYELPPQLSQLFAKTISYLMEPQNINYFRYQAIAYLKEPQRSQYPRALTISKNLAGIMKTLMIKRLESSFEAFRITLKRLFHSTQTMIGMFESNRVLIAPELNINDLSMNEIEDLIQKNNPEDSGNHCFASHEFKSGFLQGLKKDAMLLKELVVLWEQVNEDPKFDTLWEALEHRFFQKTINPSGKLVIFTESKDTAHYLEKKLKSFPQKGVLQISAENRQKKFTTIQQNFDASTPDDQQKNDVHILISTDVLSEGVNLHRANLMVNYDTPWNATQLIQRAGRLNRIGGVAETLHNFHFYPSQQGDKEINLYQTALRKLQGIHSAFGEDTQIFSKEEWVEQFKLFKEGQREEADPNMREEADPKLKYLQVIRQFKADDPAAFDRIAQFPPKARTARRPEPAKGAVANSSVVFLKSDRKNEFYQVTANQSVTVLDFVEAARIFEATPSEPAQALPPLHYDHIQGALKKFEKELKETAPARTLSHPDQALKFLRELKNLTQADHVKQAIETLSSLIKKGVIAPLPEDLKKIKKQVDQTHLSHEQAGQQVVGLANRYGNSRREGAENPSSESAPHIVISETFL